MLRVIVAESNVVARSLLVEMLRLDHGIEVVAEARNGAEAIEMTKRLRPDLVIMGTRLQKVDGFEATKEIMIEQPTPVVLVVDDPKSTGVDAAQRASEAGALAVISAAALTESSTAWQARQNFLATVRAMSQVKLVRRSRRNGDKVRPSGFTLPANESPARIVAIAASTGGPAALQVVLAGLSADSPAPVLVVQHIASGFVQGVASWLDEASPLTVKVAEDGERLNRSTVYLAPDHRHLGVCNRSRIRLVDEPPIGGFRPSATYLFESVAHSFGAGALAIILTGMGRDGVDGLYTVRARGGRVIAQDEASSVVFGMPRAAIEAGLATEILPIGQIAKTVNAVVQNGG